MPINKWTLMFVEIGKIMANCLIHKSGNSTHHIDLLWTNPNPSSAMDAQTIELGVNTSKYGMFFIPCYTGNNGYYPNYTYLYSYIWNIPASDLLPNMNVIKYQETQPYGRYVTINATSLSITTNKNLGGSSYSNDTEAIPIAIYGVR